MPIDVKYGAAATATGGRDGKTRTEDGKIDLQLAIAKELGGPGGDGVSPEQLFAAGYVPCFLSAVKGAGQKLKVRPSPEATVTAVVGIGMNPEGGFGLAIELTVYLPSADREQAQQVIELAHQLCPYSNATRNNVDVQLSLA